MTDAERAAYDDSLPEDSCPVCGSDDLEYDMPDGPGCVSCGCLLSVYFADEDES